MKNKQDNEYRMLCPAPSMKEELAAVVGLVAQHLGREPLALGVLCPSGVSMASGSLVCTGLFLHPWEDGELPQSLLPGIFRCPAGLPFRLLLGHLGVAVSTCTAGSVTETQRLVSSCLEPYISRKGDFRAPMTPAGHQDSGEGGGSNRGIRNRTRCAFPPRLGLYSYRMHCLDSPRFFSTCSDPALSHGLEQALPALTLQVQLWPLASAYCWEDTLSGSQLHLDEIGLSIWRTGSFRTLPPSSSLYLSALTLGLSADLLGRGVESSWAHCLWCSRPQAASSFKAALL